MTVLVPNTEHRFTSLVIDDLVRDNRSGGPALRNVSLSFYKSELVALIGPCSMEKSALLRCINRLVEPQSGAIVLDGENLLALKGRALRAARRRIGMVLSEPHLLPGLTVIENLLAGRLGYLSAIDVLLRRFPQEDIERALKMLETLGLQDLAGCRASLLDRGQSQRVSILRAAMQHPSLILAEDPTAGLDQDTAMEILELLQRIVQSERIPVLVCLCDIDLARRFASRIIGLSEGQIRYDGTAENLDTETLQHIYGSKSWLQ